MDDDDYFSGDDLGDIPANTLQALESHAFVSTQVSRQDVSAPKTSDAAASVRRHPHNTISFNRPATSNKIPPWRPPQRSQQIAAQSGPPPSAPEIPSSDYGLDEEDVIDLDEPSMIVQPASSVAHRHRATARVQPPVANFRGGSRAELDSETAAAFAAADQELSAYNADQWAHAPHLAPESAGANGDITSLKARIAELEANQARLRRAEQDARNAALAKQGEIAIVRANQEKAGKEYERRIAVMQKLHQDEASKQKAEIEASKKEREKMETDNRFLQHDLAQEAERMKRLNGPGKARAGSSKPRESPYKAKRTSLGDGFADEEMIMLVSPSKSKDRSRDQTPKAGIKRKRQAQDSPLAPLVLSQPAPPQRENNVQSAGSVEVLATRPAKDQQDDKFKFLQSLLNYRPSPKFDRTVEALTKHHFPSDIKKSLSALFLDNLSSQPSQEPISLQTAHALMDLWSRCITEEYYSPLLLILDMIRFVLHFELASTSASLIEVAVPLCIKTIELVDLPRARASLNPVFAASQEFKAQQQLATQVDVGEVLDFLQFLARASTLSSERNEAFWRQMSLTFTLLILNKAHPIEQIIGGLQILGTSTLPTTFSVVCGDPEGQTKLENNTLDHLTSLLFNTPSPPNKEAAYSDAEVAELRLETLKVFRSLCITDHGSFILAQHRSVIGRLTRFLDGQVRRLYALTPSAGTSPQLDESEETNAHSLVIKTINVTTRILYHLLHTFNETIDLVQKLNAVHGGYHKFLVSLTRIAFTEQLVFEHGIEKEVVEAAHTILDNVLSPEEGEAVTKAIETPRGTRSASKSTSRTSVDRTDGDVVITDAPD